MGPLEVGWGGYRIDDELACECPRPSVVPGILFGVFFAFGFFSLFTSRRSGREDVEVGMLTAASRYS